MKIDNYKARLIYSCIYATSSFSCFFAATKFTDSLCIWTFNALGSSLAMLFWLIIGNKALNRTPVLANILQAFGIGIRLSYKWSAIGLGILGLFSTTILQLGVAVFSLFQADNLWFGFKFGGILLASALFLILFSLPESQEEPNKDIDLSIMSGSLSIILTILWFIGLVSFAAAICYNVLTFHLT